MKPLLLLSFVSTLVFDPSISHGPFVGHVDSKSAVIWCRCSEPGDYKCLLTSENDRKAVVASATASPKNDLCVKFKFDNLASGQKYSYSIATGNGTLVEGADYFFKTSDNDDRQTSIKIGFGSCAKEDNGTANAWKKISELNLDAFVLLGDTPYIDTTNLGQQRKRYREFAAVKPMAKLFRSTSMYGVWDDHDFGRNDTNGKLKGKENSRQSFTEFRANSSFGNGTAGIYSKFRRGTIEVFLLDTRYFAATENSPFADNQPSLLGSDQWNWLKQSLMESSATFKVLACGMVWNGAVRIGKRDHWMTYSHERDELFRFIGAEKIAGVVLVAGDIHRSRVIKHAAAEIAGYDLYEFISSPLHSHVIGLAKQPHPGLLFDAGEPHTFLTLATNSNSTVLVAKLQNAAGEILFEKRLKADSLNQTKK